MRHIIFAISAALFAVAASAATFHWKDNAAMLTGKLGVYENVVGRDTMPFYLDLGFTKTEVGAVVKLFGTWAVILGGLLGAGIMLRIGTAGGGRLCGKG